jgi:hypothetical protein
MNKYARKQLFLVRNLRFFGENEGVKGKVGENPDKAEGPTRIARISTRKFLIL